MRTTKVALEIFFFLDGIELNAGGNLGLIEAELKAAHGIGVELQLAMPFAESVFASESIAAARVGVVCGRCEFLGCERGVHFTEKWSENRDALHHYGAGDFGREPALRLLVKMSYITRL